MRMNRKVVILSLLTTCTLWAAFSLFYRLNPEAGAEYRLVDIKQIAKNEYIVLYVIDTSTMAAGSTSLAVSVEKAPAYFGDKKNRIMELRHGYNIRADVTGNTLTIVYPMTADIKILSTDVSSYRIQIQPGAISDVGYLKSGANMGGSSGHSSYL